MWSHRAGDMLVAVLIAFMAIAFMANGAPCSPLPHAAQDPEVLQESAHSVQEQPAEQLV